MLLTQFLNTILTSVLFFDMLERRYPNEFKNALIQASYNCIFYYSKLQISVFKINNKINKYIEDNSTLLQIRNELNNIIKKSMSQCKKTKCIKNGELIDDLSEISNYDFEINTEQDTNLCELFYNGDNLNKKRTFEESEIKFMLIELIIGDNTYKIDLKNDNFNYYLVDNKFTKQFFVFYLKHHLKVFENANYNSQMTLKVIDHNVVSFEINFTDKNEYLMLEKNGYKLEITSL